MVQVKHLMLLKFKPQTTREEIGEIFEAFDELPDLVPGTLELAGGPYNSHEGLHQGFTHGLAITFADATCRDAYLEHPHRKALVQRMLEHIQGGESGMIAFDFDVCDRFRYS